MRRRRLCLLAGLALAVCLAFSLPGRAQTPARVVSMNLCTDQLAMMLAAEGQLHSVSYIAQDRRASAMAEEAQDYVTNRGLAEEIYLMQPDLVIAGQYSTQATTAMLKRLGIPVVVFPAAASLEDVRERIARMGEALHREEAAARLLEEYDAQLAALRAEVSARPSAVLYYANGYTSGETTLAGQILLAAGFDNAAVEAGYSSGMKLPLEVLAMTDPDIVITATPYPGSSRSEEILEHPVVQAFRKTRAGATMTDHDWVCGTPYVLRAIEQLGAARGEIAGAGE